MTDTQIQQLIDNARTNDSDLVTWDELKAILEGLKSQVSLTDITASDGQIPKYSGGTWIAANDLTADPGSGGTLQDVMTNGNTTDAQFYLDKTLTIPTVDGQAVTHKWFVFDNLAKTDEANPYKRAKYIISQKAVRQGGNAPTGKVNETMMFGWNLNPGGGNDINEIPAIGISMESNYRDAGQRLCELHDFYVTPDGQQIRLRSYTVRTADFVIDYYKTISRFYLKLPELGSAGNEKQYFVVSPSNSGASIGFGADMGGRDGGIKSVTLEANFDAGGGVSISQAGLTQPQFYSYGFTHWNLPGLTIARAGSQTNVKLMGTSANEIQFDLEADAVAWLGVTNRAFLRGHIMNMQTRTKASDPTTSDIVDGYWMLYKNSSSGSLKLWANDGGIMKSVTLS